MNRTPEQDQAVELFATGETIAIEAGAGTGKTTTLVEIAKSTSRRGTYVAFNKAIVVEGERKFPANVKCSTAHALAYQAVGKDYRGRLNGPRVKSADVARFLGIDPLVVEVNGESKRLAPGWLAGLVNRAIANFCNSADSVPTRRHVPYTEGIDGLDQTTHQRSYYNNNLVAAHLEPALVRAWADLQKTAGTLRFTHDCYLKMWQLSHPVIPGEFILFDEAQDASPVMLAVVAEQSSQVVWVGDTQQQIYDWRGAVNALANVDASHRTFLTQSFRFGPEVAEVANKILTELEAELRLDGVGGPSVVGPVELPDAVLCRTNAGAFKRFVEALGDGMSPHLVGGGAEVSNFAKASIELQTRGFTAHAELSCFGSWSEVVTYVDQDEDGSDLKMLVDLVEEYGAERIIFVMDNMPSEANADLIISTAHKAKGREWDSVQLFSDFPAGLWMNAAGQIKGRELTASDWRLVYVACTRAKQSLDIVRVVCLDSLGLDLGSPDGAEESVGDVAEVTQDASELVGATVAAADVAVVRSDAGIAAVLHEALQGSDVAAGYVPTAGFERLHDRAKDAILTTGDSGTFEGTRPVEDAQAGDRVSGAFYRSQVTGNVRGHYGEVEHLAEVVNRYGVKDHPELGKPYVWAHPICGAKDGRIVSVAEAARFRHVSVGEITPCERCLASTKR
jgi:hypothetical protein